MSDHPGLAPTVADACARWGPRGAVTHRGRTLTYSRLWERIGALAHAYRGLGVGPGDRVVCQLPTCPEHLVAVQAAWACGAIHVGADKDLTGHELAALAVRTGAAVVVAQPPTGAPDPHAGLQAVRNAAPETVRVVHGRAPVAGEHALAQLPAGPADHLPGPWTGGPDDTALLLLTSGTTGRPKAVMETLPALRAKMDFFAEGLDCGPDDVHLLFLPLAHAFGLKLTTMALRSGGRVVLCDRFAPDAVLDLVGREQVTVLPATPTHLRLLLDAYDPARHRVGSLRWVISAAAGLPPGLFDELDALFGVRLLYVYGCSEGFLTRTSDPDDIRAGSVGREVFHAPNAPPDGTVAILDVDDATALPVGHIGQIAFGSVRPVRYWQAPSVATDGWYPTGDLGRLDNDGRLYVCGRLKETVNRGGLKVAAGEVEAALADLAGVAECAVIPTPDPVLGEAICACVVPAGPRPPTLAQLRQGLAGTLARHKLPDELCLPAAIPRTAIGKIDRTALLTAVVDGRLARQQHRPVQPPSTPHRGT